MVSSKKGVLGSSMDGRGKIRFFLDLSPKETFGRAIFFLSILAVLLVAVITLVTASRWINKPFAGFLVNERMVLGNVGRYYWSGTIKGLKTPDKILEANGTPIHSMKDLDEVVKKSHPGIPVTYTVKRGETVIRLQVPTMLFSLGDFLVIYGTYFFAGIVYLIVYSSVYIMKPDTKVSWAFVLGNFSIIVYFLTSFDVQSTQVGLSRIYIFFTALIPAAGFHLGMVFPEEKAFVVRRPYLQIVPYAVSLLLGSCILLSYPGAIFVRLFRMANVLMGVSVIALLISVFHAYLIKTSPIARQRAKVVLFGAAIAFPLPAFALILSVLGRTLGSVRILNNFLTIPALFFPLSIAYAIAKHNLFDVDVFIKRTVGYVLMTGIVGTMYLSMQLILRSWVLSSILWSSAEQVYPVLFALLVVFLFNPVNRRVQSGVDKIFYRKRFDYKDTVISVSNALSSVLNLEEIIRKIIHTVRQEMFIDMSGIVVLEPQKEVSQAVIVSEGSSAGREEINNVIIPNNDPLLSLVSREKKLITRYDIDEDPRYHPERERCMKRFSAMGATMVVPLIHQDEVKAVLAVGQKKSGHFYSREDVELISTLATQGAVAIVNAKLAEQMQKEEVVRTNLARYLSPQIVDQIVSHDVQVNLGGERKVVTVLFSDIRNFTTITEGRPPDQLVQILNEYFTEMAGVIFENQGSLDKYIGDAVVAVFGSLIPLENPPRNAVAAAVGMMEKVSELNRHWEGRYAFSMNIGIGVATGEVFLGNVGSPERMEFTVIGDAVNVASRFSGLARGGQILVTKPVADRLGDAFRLATLPPAGVKGKSGKMEVFEVLYTQPVS